MENQVPPSSGFTPASNPLSESDARLYGMLAHVSGIMAIALGGMAFIGPLLVWLIFKDRSSFVDYHGKEALNFSITMMVAYVLLGIIGILTCGLGWTLFAVAFPLQVIFNVIAGIKAYNGELYQYPINWRVIK